MKNFARAVRIALRLRLTLAGSVACALIVAALWGGSIFAIYPLVDVVLQGDTMSQWVDGRIRYSTDAITSFEQKAARITRLLDQDSPAALERAIGTQRAAVASAADMAELERLLAAGSAAERQRLLQQTLADARDRIGAETSALRRLRRFAPAIHAYTPADPFGTLLLIVVALLLALLVKDLFMIGGAILVARLDQRTTLQLRRRFFHQTLNMDLAALGRISRGDLISRFTGDMARVGSGITTLFGRAVVEPLKMATCLVWAGLICWRLLVVALIVAPLAGWLVNRLSKSLKRANRRAMEEMGQIYNRFAEALGGIKVVKAFTMEAEELKRFQAVARQYYRKAMKVARYSALISPLNELMGMIAVSLAVLAGAALTLSHDTHILGIKMSDRPLTPGACMLFYGFLAGAIDPARKMAGIIVTLQSAAAASDRVFAVLQQQRRVLDPKKPRSLPRHQHALSFDRVSFAYLPGQPVLQEIGLDVTFGETVALVGANGCGKTTLASLIPRFFDPTAGRVLLDGIDLREVRQHDLRQQIAIVDQEALLFDDTIANNIRYGAPTASDDQLVEAARRAQADRFVTGELAGGYEARVGPGGRRLSGGQRQRIALARAILRDPAILILDEATSQIDMESERLIHTALKQFIRGRTTLIITHRLATLELADRIVVMDQGRIAATGTHQQLTTCSDIYRRLWETQYRRSA